MKCMHILVITNWAFIAFVQSFTPFKLSVSCTHDYSKCDKEELEYLSIAELHDQIDDDKNGNIDITESKDFVKESLNSYRGTEKANFFHKDDAQIDKQDLWHIWRTSEVSTWTTNDLLIWLSDEVDLPQYTEVFTNIKLNGSSLPRLTGNDYLRDIVGIVNSIHRKKIMIKAVDAVLFGPTKKYQLTTQRVIIWSSVFTLITICFFVQTIYSKRFVKKMQKQLDSLSESESTLSELRDRIKEAEKFKQKKDIEIQEMQERHRFEISSSKNSSRDSLITDNERLQDAYKDITKLKAVLRDSQLQINKLTSQLVGHSLTRNDHSDNSHLLQSLLQLTYVIERQYLAEKITVIDRQSMEIKELNEKIKKKKSSFMGSFRLIHTNDLDELEKGFATTKKAYETLIHEKLEQESRWSKLESITALNLIHCGDLSSIKQVIQWTDNTSNDQEHRSSPVSKHRSNDAQNENIQLYNKCSDDKASMKLSDFEIQPIQNSPLEIKNHTQDSVNVHTTEHTTSAMCSRKDFSETRRPLYGGGRTRIASLNRSTKKY